MSNLKKLPEGYMTIPIAEDQKSSTLKICILVRSEPDPAGGHLVVLRNTIDAKVFLGCVVDASSRILDWLELWIQNGCTLINTPTASRLSLTNAVLDDRWQGQIRAFEQVDAAAIVKTGLESSHPLPTLLDISTGVPVHPMDSGSRTPWKLCTDEGLLQENDLPSYSGSLHRYLHNPASGPDSKLVPITPRAPTNNSTKPLSEVWVDRNGVIPFNNAAGLMLVRKHDPIGLETYIDILSGAPWDGLKHGRSLIDLGEQIAALGKDETNVSHEGRLFLDRRGRCGRLIETLHLKLRLLADIVSSTHATVYHLQRPLLGLGPESYQMRLGEVGRGLPFLWTAKAVLSDAGDAISFRIGGSDLQYYVLSPAAGTSIYRPIVSSLPTKGNASIRIRRVVSETADTTVMEGTFSTQERIDISGHDLVWLRISLACGDIDLYAYLESDSAMAAHEWRFRTVAQYKEDAEVAALKAAEGVPMPEVPFEIIPSLSTPCDLYSLAVLAVRILLVDNTNSLPISLDEMLSLMRQIEVDHDESAGMEKRISDLFNNDNRWLESLGPQHLTFEDIGSDEVFYMIPQELWWEALRTILRMFPGMGPESECKDYGDAQPGGLHKVFEQTMDALDNLILKTRSLIVFDWKSNEEISSVIHDYLT